MSIFCEKESLKNESDVEQKIIYPFLTEEKPIGCGFAASDILTKDRIKPYKIGKAKQELYVPDYIIELGGIPLIIIEAKSPNEDVNNGFQEARLYANELNSTFSHTKNPCNIIMMCNGLKIVMGYVDHNIPVIEVDFDDIRPSSIKYSDLLKYVSKESMYQVYKEIITKVRGDAKFTKPVSNLSKKVRNSEMEENGFGRAVSLDYNRILIPEGEEEYKTIVKNAYVKSKKREQHIEPILKTIRSLKLPSIDEATLISSEESDELISGIKTYTKNKDKRYSLILLIGEVGSGKTTFIRYLKNVVIGEKSDFSKSLNWIIINMNNAPLARNELYKWIVKESINSITDQCKECDFGNIEFLKTIFYNEIKIFENGIGSLLKSDIKEYRKQLFQLLKELINDNEKTLKNLLLYFRTYKKTDFILVLDNVDKNLPVDQLLFFQVAEWYRKEFLCLIIMPMRSSTYNTYRSTPPLDTVIKDMVFRIDPPDLLKVLQNRMEYIYRIEEGSMKSQDYLTKNGIRVYFNKEKFLEYIKYILVSIRNDGLVKFIFYSITGKNIRSGIELFIDFMKSGHLSADHFLAIRASRGEYNVPNSILMNAILRGNRHYYNDLDSKIKNLFYSDYHDDWVDPFVRIDILLWCQSHYNKTLSSGVKGFNTVNSIEDDLTIIGHTKRILYRELTNLINYKLLEIDGEVDDLKGSDLIRITQFGYLHLKLLKNISYLAACSEDIYYRDNNVAQRISERIRGETGDGHFSKSTVFLNVDEMVSYLLSYRDNYISSANSLLNSSDLQIYDLKDCISALERLKVNQKDIYDLNEKKKKYFKNNRIECIVSRIESYGIFVTNFEDEGFIHISKLNHFSPNDFEIADLIMVKVLDFKEKHNRYEMEFIEILSTT